MVILKPQHCVSCSDTTSAEHQDYMKSGARVGGL